MRKYFYSDGTNKFGPFTLEELRLKNITRETKVWFQELADWQPAGTIPELSEIFKFTPPPISNSGPNFNNGENMMNQKPPKSWLVESILVTLFCCLPFGIAEIVNAARVESRYNSGNIDGAYQASKEAKKWTLVSFWLGLIGGILYVILMLTGAISGFYQGF